MPLFMPTIYAYSRRKDHRCQGVCREGEEGVGSTAGQNIDDIYNPILNTFT